MKDITLFELDVFTELSKSQTLRSVARAKSLTPSHVSKILTRLEKKLDSNLFKRCASGLMLTPEGRNLIGYAEKILHEAKAFDGPALSNNPQRLIGIGGINFLINRLMVPIIQSLTTKYPNTRFRLMNLIPDHVMPSGMLGAYEIALHMGQLPWPSTWASVTLGKMPFQLVARASHPLSTQTTEKEVQKYPFVVPNYWSSEGFYTGNDSCPLSWNQRIRGHEVSQAENAIAIARHTDHLVFGPLLISQPWLRTGELKAIEVKEWTTSVSKPVCLTVQGLNISKSLQLYLIKKLKAELKDGLSLKPSLQ